MPAQLLAMSMEHNRTKADVQMQGGIKHAMHYINLCVYVCIFVIEGARQQLK